MNNQDNQFKVRLSAAASAGSASNLRENSVVFDVSPDLVENRNVNYKSFDPVHAPGQIYVYQSTAARTFQLSAIKLISRTSEEASHNLARLWTLRSWTLPNFGVGIPQNGQAASQQAEAGGTNGFTDARELVRSMSEGGPNNQNRSNFLGAPPPVLYLSAYSRLGASTGTGSIGHLRNIPTVITQMSIPYPTDVDYIPTADAKPTPMPTLMTLDIQLTETHSPREYEQFSLESFRVGDLTGF